ncbi:MAG: hypothetical protein CMG71_05735 [Candidatus Marinimicrobia bacterium]|nr:hypothetical protein [Candidatus Neomarinimicrobiota bacterium]|tara:strand:+ start:3883 stop:4089 length:207 start_codon:yes stop_codon:yes gene_type:complete
MDNLDYFALFYVGGILLFGLFMRRRYKRKQDQAPKILLGRDRVNEEMAKKIMEDARSHRKARGVDEES